MEILSHLAHLFELLAMRTPGAYAMAAVGCGGAVLALISAYMIWQKFSLSMAARKDRSAIARSSYRNGWLLRASQSRVWPGLLLLGSGVAVLVFSAWRLDPRMKTHAIRFEQSQLRAPSQNLRSDQESWREIFRSRAFVGDAWEIPQGVSANEVAAIAAYSQGQQRTLETLGVLAILVGLIYALRQSVRESLGGEEHGQSALASRAEITYAETGTWSLPMRVSQRGLRHWEIVDSEPVTVAKPPLKTQVVHTCGIGASGAGKGAFLGGHIFQTTPPDVPIFYFDYKGEMPAYPLRPQMLRWGFPGQRPKGLPSMRFNYMDWVRNHEEPDTAAKILAGAILPANSKRESDNAWIKDTALPILADGILSGRWANMAELADEIEHTPLIELLDKLHVGRGRRAAFDGRNVPEYAQNEISNNTAPYLSGRARHIVSASDFTFDEMLHRGVYIMGQVGSIGERRAITMMWNVFWAELLRKSDPQPGVVFIDEAVANGPVPRVEEALVTLRDREIQLIQFFQMRSGLTSVYGRDLAEVVWDAHQTHIILTKGLNLQDIKYLVNAGGTYTVPPKRKGDRPEKADLFPFDRLKAHCRQEKYWAYIDGVAWTKSGYPILCELQPIPPDGWNWRASKVQYEAELTRMSYGVEFHSAYKMKRVEDVELTDPKTKECHRFAHWVPEFPEAAEKKGITEKHVLIEDCDKFERLRKAALDEDAKRTHDPVKDVYRNVSAEIGNRADAEAAYGL